MFKYCESGIFLEAFLRFKHRLLCSNNGVDGLSGLWITLPQGSFGLCSYVH